MAAAQLIFDEQSLDQSSILYSLYSRFLSGIQNANSVDAIEFLDSNGNVKLEYLHFAPPGSGIPPSVKSTAIIRDINAQNEIMMKNSAFNMANAITTAFGIGDDEGGDDEENPSGGTVWISRRGDSMTGQLNALYGFQAGSGGNVIFQTFINNNDDKIARVYGNLIVDEDATVNGQLNLGNSGIYFGGNQSIWYDVANQIIKIGYQDGHVGLSGDVTVNGTFTLGNVVIDQYGISFGNYEFYHSGNSNNSETDWAMRDAHVYGDLIVDGAVEHNGRLTALYGFDLGEDNTPLLYSIVDEDTGDASVIMASDLSIVGNHGIKFNDQYIIKTRGGNNSIVSFSAPGMVMNLGDSDDNVATDHIALQTDIYNFNSTYKLISKEGSGYFPNSLKAGCASAGATVLETYSASNDDCGVVFQNNIRLGRNTGPAIYTDSEFKQAIVSLPYVHVVEEEVQQTEWLPLSLKLQQTDSLFANLSYEWSASLHLATSAEFFSFDNPVEVSRLSIISARYKTSLQENVLFFGDNIFLEGKPNGIRHAGNSYFDGDLSSPTFSSGFAGSGWAILRDGTTGSIRATFDELTIRKKMRVYELEVQKVSATNGSLWVTDSCSGDLVTEIV